MRNSRYQLAIQLIEKYATEDQRVQKLLSRILDHLGAASENTSKLFEQTARFFFTLCPWRYGAASEELSEDQQNDQEKSVAELIVANHDRISEEQWFSDAESHEWIALVAVDYLENGLLSRRVIENWIARGDVEDLGELENADVNVASHMSAICFQTAEILTVADCFVREKKIRRAKARKGASKRHERSYRAIRGFIVYYERNGLLSRNEAARRYYRESLADLKPPLYRNEEQAVRSLTTALRKNIGLKE